jgi:hypothetical protein
VPAALLAVVRFLVSDSDPNRPQTFDISRPIDDSPYTVQVSYSTTVAARRGSSAIPSVVARAMRAL